MKAYRLHEFAGPDAYRLEELPSPTPGHGEVLVRIRAVSLNYRDLMISKGVYNPRLRLPLIPLSDGVGEVAVTGAGVTRFKPGERVAACFMPTWVGGQLDEAKARSTLGGDVDGVLAEEVVLPEEGLVRIPEHLSLEEAATLPCSGVTAWHALVFGGSIKPGDTI
ncbi:MAG: zinc-dependent alcohol dehydrogenase family protein [Isosphaeraceae bacterium]